MPQAALDVFMLLKLVREYCYFEEWEQIHSQMPVSKISSIVPFRIDQDLPQLRQRPLSEQVVAESLKYSALRVWSVTFVTSYS